MKQWMAAGLLLLLAGCVTPLTAEQQQPMPGYVAPGKTVIGVVEDRARTEEGRAPTMLGYARNYGIPNHWHVKHIVRTPKEDRSKTAAQLLATRIAQGFTAKGSTVEEVAMTAPLSDSDASSLIQSRAADRLVTFVLREWHFDVNLNWVGKFRFDSEIEVLVQRPGEGVVLRQTYKDSQAIQGIGDKSWGNMILEAYKAKLEQIINSPEVRSALTAPPAPAAVAEPATAAAPSS
ncbi:MAG: hypothetical protein SGJ23_05265 [Alphaproteobacteria bacterium]|nr:hypothetical protein [Alphaproteobacteria bacterium]